MLTSGKGEKKRVKKYKKVKEVKAFSFHFLKSFPLSVLDICFLQISLLSVTILRAY